MLVYIIIIIYTCQNHDIHSEIEIMIYNIITLTIIIIIP